MEDHMREHGPLYTSLPCVTFDEGGWVGGWRGVVVLVLLLHPSFLLLVRRITLPFQLWLCP